MQLPPWKVLLPGASLDGRLGLRKVFPQCLMYCIVGWRKTVAFRCFAGLSCGFRFEYQVVYRGNLLDAQNMPIEVIISAAYVSK